MRHRQRESGATEAQAALERIEELLGRQPLTSLEQHWLAEDLRPLREAAKIGDPGAVNEELRDLRWQIDRARDALDF